MTALIFKPGGPWPNSAPWLDSATSTEFQRRIVRRALLDDGAMETDGPNRSPMIDLITKWAGLVPPVYWCAIWVARVFADAGAKIPPGFPSCDSWLPFLVPIDSVTDAQKIGTAVLYGVPGDAKHIGLITQCPRATSQHLPTLTIEGNRGFAGSGTNNGVAVDQAPMSRKDILGIVLPVAA